MRYKVLGKPPCTYLPSPRPISPSSRCSMPRFGLRVALVAGNAGFEDKDNAGLVRSIRAHATAEYVLIRRADGGLPEARALRSLTIHLLICHC